MARSVSNVTIKLDRHVQTLRGLAMTTIVDTVLLVYRVFKFRLGNNNLNGLKNLQ